jgi:OmpA-OmpF porin, OOP family
MMMAMTKTILCALLICATEAPFHTCAADENTAAHSGFQFGLGVGGGQLHVSEPDTSASIEMGAFAYTAFAGYRINRYMAVEVSYLDGGPMRKENSESLFATEPHIATATGMGILPIGQTFSLFARAGLAHWWYNTDFGVAGLGSVSFSKTSNELIWGAGTSVSVDNAQVRLEFGQSKANPNFDGLALDMRLQVLTLSVVWML